MAIVTVPRPLQEQLTGQQEQIAELGKQIGAVHADVNKQIGAVHADLHKQIGGVRADLHKQIGGVHADLHKQIARQTRWILTVLGGAAVLFPIVQRVMAALLP